MNEGISGIGMSKHRKSGATFKSRRTKMAMEREANKQKIERKKQSMVDSFDKLFKK